MDLEVTPEAIEVLARSLKLASLDSGAHGVRLRLATGLGGGHDVQVELADAPGDAETVLELGGVRIFVDARLSEVFPAGAVVTVEPQHEKVVVRPAAHGR